MKRIFLAVALSALLLTPMALSAADNASPAKRNPAELITGEVWQNSQPDNKKAWLFGIDTAVDVEKAVNQAMQKNRKGKQIPLSPFARAWIEAFGGNTTLDETVALVDQWYKANPDKLDRPVLDMIWYEIVLPRTSGK